MKNTRNPFILTPFVPKQYFCDRENETTQLCKHILNGRNVALFAKRRLGKTGLIRHCFEQDEIKNAFNTFLVDIYPAGSLKEMTSLFAKEVFSNSKAPGIQDKILRGLKSVQPKIAYNELTSTYSLSIGMGDIFQPEKTLEEILSIIDGMKKPSIVAIDEFQKIRDFQEKNAEAYLRTAFQKCKNIVFLFTGSIGHSMNNIFKSPDKPFYNSAVMMTINVIDRDVYKDFALKMFHSGERDIEEALIEKCYDYFDGVTWYNQLMMNEAYAQTDKGGTISIEAFDSIYEAIIAQQAFSYQELFSRFSSKQKQLLLAIAREDKEGAMVTSQAFLQKYGLGGASSSQTAANALKKGNYISDNGNKKQITDLIFRDWLKKL